MCARGWSRPAARTTSSLTTTSSACTTPHAAWRCSRRYFACPLPALTDVCTSGSERLPPGVQLPAALAAPALAARIRDGVSGVGKTSRGSRKTIPLVQEKELNHETEKESTSLSYCRCRKLGVDPVLLPYPSFGLGLFSSSFFS